MITLEIGSSKVCYMSEWNYIGRLQFYFETIVLE